MADNPHADLGFTPAATPASHDDLGFTPATGFQQPEGGAFGRFVKGAWEVLNPGPLLKMTADAVRSQVSGQPLSPETAQALGGIVQGHIDQFQKAKDALNQGRHSEAFGHLVATGLPFVGPAAANAAEKMGGEGPTFDRYGNVVKQGQAPDIAGGMGQAAGLIGGIVAPPYIAKGAKAVGRGIASKAAATAEKAVGAAEDAVSRIPTKLNPVQQGAVAFLEERGVPLNVGTRTGNQFAKSVQATVAASPLGAPAAAESAAATEAGLTRVARELASEAHPNSATPETAGRSVATRIDKKIEGIHIAETGAYKEAWKHANDPQFTYDMPVRTPARVPLLDSEGRPTGEFSEGPPVMKKVAMPVDVRDIKAVAEDLMEEMKWMPAPERNANAGYQALKVISEGDDFIPAPAAERGLSGLKSLARAENPNLRNVGQGVAARIVPDLQEQIDAAVAHTGDDAFKGLQSGRALHASKMEIADIADKLREEPVQAFKQVTWRNDTGIDYLRKVNEHAPESLPEIGRAFVDELFTKATQEGGFGHAKKILNDWQALGPETKKLLFKNPYLRKSLDRFFQGAALVAENPNPSGTAVVSSASSMNPLRWLAGYAGSKLLFSPRGVSLLTESMKPEIMRNPAASQLLQTQMLRLLGKSAAMTAGKDE
jgi:hypothetical protein